MSTCKKEKGQMVWIDGEQYEVVKKIESKPKPILTYQDITPVRFYKYVVGKGPKSCKQSVTHWQDKCRLIIFKLSHVGNNIDIEGGIIRTNNRCDGSLEDSSSHFSCGIIWLGEDCLDKWSFPVVVPNKEMEFLFDSVFSFNHKLGGQDES